MVKRIKIGLLIGSQRNPRLYNILQEIGDVSYLTPTEKSAKYDIIVLSPDMGINPNLDCFKHGHGIPINPIDPVIEVFRENCLEYYLDLDTFVVGIGDNACLLWNELNNQVAVTSHGLQMMDNSQLHHSNILGVRDYFIDGFRVNNLIGLKTIDNLGVILLSLKKEIQSMMDDDESSNVITEQVVPKNPIIVNAASNEDEEEAC